VSSREFTEWLAYERLHPPEEDRADVRHAHLMTLLANVNRDPKRQPRPWTAEDFLPRWHEDPVPTDEQLYAKIIGINAAFGGSMN
jgi:hypothetical protein